MNCNKNLLKNLILLIIMVLVLVLLTGCEEKSVLATRTTEDDSIFGRYKEEIEIFFKKEDVYKAKMTIEFEDEEKANSAYELLDFDTSNLEKNDYKTKKKDNKIVIEMSAEIYKKQYMLDDENMTKEKLQEYFEEFGYEVKS